MMELWPVALLLYRQLGYQKVVATRNARPARVLIGPTYHLETAWALNQIWLNVHESSMNYFGFLVKFNLTRLKNWCILYVDIWHCSWVDAAGGSDSMTLCNHCGKEI